MIETAMTERYRLVQTTTVTVPYLELKDAIDDYNANMKRRNGRLELQEFRYGKWETIRDTK